METKPAECRTASQAKNSKNRSWKKTVGSNEAGAQKSVEEAPSTEAAPSVKTAPPKASAPGKRKKSSVRHTRAIQRDRRVRPSVAPSDEQVEAPLKELIHPATLAQVADYQRRGLRERLLTLPIMMAFVLSLLWRHIGSVREAVRMLRDEGLLGSGPVDVSHPATTERLRTLPPSLFRAVLDAILPTLQQRFQARKRPLPPALAYALTRFTGVWALDGSTLDALQKKVGLLRGTEGGVLAGRMAALLDVASQLPRQLG